MESFQERAQTRLSKDYPVALPVGGRIGRLDLEPGDKVTRGQTLTSFDAFPLRNQEQLDRASIDQLNTRLRNSRDLRVEEAELKSAEQAVRVARSRLGTLRAQLQSSQKVEAQARRDYQRTQNLVQEGALPQQRLEADRLRYEQAALASQAQRRQLNEAQAEVARAQTAVNAVRERMRVKLEQSQEVERELDRARLALDRTQYEVGKSLIEAPVDGVVLERKVQGPIDLPAGTVLLRIGRLEDLEGVSEVLSQDALKLELGDRVELDLGAGTELLRATVREIEPAGFTKLSSLGVEQQRVLVLLDLEKRPQGLGVGYEMQARFVVEEKAEVLKIPRFSVLEDSQGQKFVLKVVSGRLQKQVIKVGLQGDTELEVLEGLNEGDQLVKTPETRLKGGESVEVVDSKKSQ